MTECKGSRDRIPRCYSLRSGNFGIHLKRAGWDENGIPAQKTLNKLDLDFVSLSEIS